MEIPASFSVKYFANPRDYVYQQNCSIKFLNEFERSAMSADASKQLDNLDPIIKMELYVLFYEIKSPCEKHLCSELMQSIIKNCQLGDRQRIKRVIQIEKLDNIFKSVLLEINHYERIFSAGVDENDACNKCWRLFIWPVKLLCLYLAWISVKAMDCLEFLAPYFSCIAFALLYYNISEKQRLDAIITILIALGAVLMRVFSRNSKILLDWCHNL